MKFYFSEYQNIGGLEMVITRIWDIFMCVCVPSVRQLSVRLHDGFRVMISLENLLLLKDY